VVDVTFDFRGTFMGHKGLYALVIAVVAVIVAVAMAIGLAIRPRGLPPDPTRYLPGEPVAYVAVADLDEVLETIGDSRWWRTLTKGLLADEGSATILAKLKQRHRKIFKTSIRDHLAAARVLIGGRVDVGFYSGLRGLSWLAAVTPTRRLSADDVQALVVDFGRALGWPKPKIDKVKYAGQVYHRLALPRGPVLVYVPRGRTIYASTNRRLIERVIDRVTGKAGPVLADDKLYRQTRAGAVDQARLWAFIQWDKLPARRGRGFWSRLLDSIGTVQISSNLVDTRIAVGFQHGPAKKILGAGLPGAGLRSARLLPQSPLIYYGSCGYRLAEVWQGLLDTMDPGVKAALEAVDRDVARSFGATGLSQLLTRTGDEVAVAVFSLLRGVLPIPQGLVFIRMRDESTASTFLPQVVSVLKGHRLLLGFVFGNRELAGRMVPYVVVPLVGEVGAARVGPYLVLGNNMDLLRTVIRGRRGVATPAWRQSQAVNQPSDLLFVDVARILALMPEVLPYFTPRLRLGRHEMELLLGMTTAVSDFFSFLRGATIWSRWEAKRATLVIGLRLGLEDRRVSTAALAKLIRLYFTAAKARVQGPRPVKTAPPKKAPEPKKVPPPK